MKVKNTTNSSDYNIKKMKSEKRKRMAMILSGLTFLGLSIYNAPEKDKFEHSSEKEKIVITQPKTDKYIKVADKKEDRKRTEAEDKCGKITGMIILGFFAYGIGKIIIMDRKEKKKHGEQKIQNDAVYTSKDFEI